MKAGAFTFYADDYLGGTIDFTLEQHGAYLLLLLLQFKEGPFTAHQAILVVGETWFRVCPKFAHTYDSDLDALVYWNQRMEKELRKKETIARETVFRRPTVIQVAKYFFDLGLNGQSETEAQTFWNYYESKGWKVGKAPMKRWQSACVNWKSNMEKFKTDKKTTYGKQEEHPFWRRGA